MKTALKSLACIVAAVASLGAMAQGPYPSRPIKMVIPFPPAAPSMCWYAPSARN